MKNGPYTLIIPPPEYPGKRYRGRYAYEHRVQWWKDTDEVLPTRVVVHHKNENKRDNRGSNLAKMSVGEHTAEHTRERRGFDVNLICTTCGNAFVLLGRVYRNRKKQNGQDVFYCSRSCQVRAQWAARR